MNPETTSPLSPRKIQVLAHRGLVSEFVPENSQKAFADALAAGADVIETDVQVSKDGVALIFHDATLLRLTGDKRKVHNVPLAEISQLDIGSGKRIATLEQVLEAFPTARFNLDLKSDQSIQATVSVIEKMQAHERVLVSSFSEARRKSALKLLTKPVETSAGVRKVLFLYLASVIGSKALFKLFAAGSTALQLPTQRGPIRFDTARFMKMARDANLEVQFWTINEPAQILRLVSLGATGIISDHCDLAIATLRNPESFV